MTETIGNEIVVTYLKQLHLTRVPLPETAGGL